MDRRFYSTLPFCFWNHMLYCMRSEYCLNMCLLCTRIYVPEKKISSHTNKHLYVSLNQFHPSIRDGIVSANKIFFFAHNNASIKKDDLRERAKRNIGVLYYECISSHFLLFKKYLDTLC